MHFAATFVRMPHKTQYQLCRRCVMDTSDPDIVFDEQGNCHHCNQYILEIEPMLQRLRVANEEFRLVAKLKARGANRKYDCVIGISGGVDSCYTAYWAKEHGIRALLVHMDNGWNSEIAVQNIRKMAIALEFDFESVVLDWKEFKAIQVAFLQSGILDIELPTDLAIPAVLHQTAAKHGIKSILSGGNYSSEGILPLQWGYHVMKDMHLYRHILRKYGNIRRKSVPAFGVFQELYYKFIRGISVYYPLNYTDYNKDTQAAFLHEKYGCDFRSGKHHESRYTAFWQSYILPEKYGFDYRRATYSTQICAGQLSREKALEQLNEPAYPIVNLQQDRAFICKKLDLPENLFQELMQAPPKTFRDFPNRYRTIRCMHRIYRYIFK